MNETTDATAIFAPIWRRKWLILLVAVLVAAGTYFYYKRQQSLFQASTQLYLAAGAEEQISEKGSGRSTVANAGTQAALINSIVVELAHKDLKKQHTRISRLASTGKVRAKATEKSEFVAITAEAHNPKSAALLVNTVAQLYIRRQHANYQRGINQAISIARRQMRRLETPRVTPASKGKSKGSTISTTSVLQAANLNSKINQLEANLALKTVEQVKPAKPKSSILLSPQPKKNAIFGFVVGLVLAAIAAFALSRFNRRLRSLADIELVLQTQVLTALPKVRSPIVERDGERRPSKLLLEPLRRFHTTLQLGTSFGVESHSVPRSILFLSADPGDGRSTVIADLALLQREAGERTAVLEADFRRPVQGKLLGIAGTQGLVEVLTGVATLEEAMQTVPSMQPESVAASPGTGGGGGVATALEQRRLGSVSVLLGSTAAANPPLLLAGEPMADLLRGAVEDFDSVLIDCPPPLEVSDAMPLLAAVDAIVLVARAGYTRESSARRLQQLLAQTPTAPVLGVVANGVGRADMKRYGVGGSNGRGWPARLTGR